MDYENLKIKEKFVGKIIFDNNKKFVLSNDLDIRDKKYIYNLITKSVFDIFETEIVEVAISAPVTDKEIKIVKVKSDKPKASRKPRTKKAK